MASGLDWGLVFVLFLLVGYPLGMIQALGEAIGGATSDAIFWFSQAVALALVAAYFGYFLASGHTLGMRALDIHVFSRGSGREPHPLRSVARSVLALGFFLASINAYGLLRGHYEGGLTDAQQHWRTAAVAGALLALAGELWNVVDPDGRTLWDRLFGLVVVEDVVPASMPDRLWSPWGT